MQKIVLLLTYIFFGAAGQLLFKYGINKEFYFKNIEGTLNVSISAWSIIGLSSYIISFLIFIYVLSIYKITEVMPVYFGGLYIALTAGGYFFLKENISTIQLIGIGFVFLGVLMLLKST